MLLLIFFPIVPWIAGKEMKKAAKPGFKDLAVFGITSFSWS